MKNLKYPNLAIFFSVAFSTYLLYSAGVLENLVIAVGKFGYIGVFITGFFFVSTFTVVPATAILFLFVKELSLPLIALTAGAGGVAGDYLLFRFLKDKLADELSEVFKSAGGSYFIKFHNIVHTRYFSWLSPVVGALIIASPLPDELGIGLLGIYKLDNKKFILLSFILNSVGIFILLSAIKSF